MTAGFTGCDERLDFQAADGIHQAIIYSENDIETEVRYQLPENMQDLSALKLPKNMTAEGLVNTGVPHLVINTADSPEHIDVKNLGRKLRYDPMFGAAGTNVNFIHVESDNNFSIRSYERGIEDETLSCGTGITAAALLFMRKKAKKEEEIIVNSRGGQLKVRIESGRLYLRGAANIVYVGRIALD
jgi:diaminopimelate epimerase